MQKNYQFPTVPSSETIDGKNVDILEHEAHLVHVQVSLGIDVKSGTDRDTPRVHKFKPEDYKRFLESAQNLDSSRGQGYVLIHKPN